MPIISQLDAAPGVNDTDLLPLAVSGVATYRVTAEQLSSYVKNNLTEYPTGTATSGQLTFWNSPSTLTGTNRMVWNSVSNTLTVSGVIESTSGGIKFPDGTTQTTAGGGGGTPAGSTGAVQFNNAGAFGADAANLFWDDTNNRLGVGTNGPQYSVHITSGNSFTNSYTECTLSTGAAYSGSKNDSSTYAYLASYGSATAGNFLDAIPQANVAALTFSSASTAAIRIPNTAPLVIFTNDTERMRVNGTDGRVGIGTVSPNTSLEVSGANAQIRASDGTGGNPGLTSYAYNSDGTAFPYMALYHSRGSRASPSNTQSGDNLGQYMFGGYDGTGFAPRASMTGYATETWSSTSNRGNQIKFSTAANGTANDVVRMTIDQNGFIGIGTTTPTTLVEIKKDQNDYTQVALTNPNAGSGAVAMYVAGADPTTIYCGGFGYFGAGRVTNGPLNADQTFMSANGPGGMFFYTAHASGAIKFSTGGLTNERMRILSTGEVGIGATAPSYKLTSNLSTSATNTVQSSYLLKTTSTGDMADGFGGGMLWGIEDTANVENLIAGATAIRDGADNSGKLMFRTWNAGSANYHLAIDKTGKVGIGTITPGYLLHAKTDQNSSTWFSIENATNGTSALAGVYINNGSKGFGLTYRPSNYTDDATLADAGVLRTDSSVAGGLKIRTGGNTPVNFGTNDTDRLTILGSGNVGIGITSPTYDLHVKKAGSVAIQSENSATTGYASVVSENNNGAYLQMFAAGSATGSGWFGNDVAPLNRAGTVGFRSAGTETALVFAANSNVPLYIGQNDTARLILGTAGAVFNESGYDYDFRVEGDTDPNLICADASTDRAGIGTATPVTAKLQVLGNPAVRWGGATTYAYVGYTDTTDIFAGNYIEAVGSDAQKGRFRLQSSRSGAGANYLMFYVDPEAGAYLVASNGTTFSSGTAVARLGIGTSTPDCMLHVKGATSGQAIVSEVTGTASSVSVEAVNGTDGVNSYLQSFGNGASGTSAGISRAGLASLVLTPGSSGNALIRVNQNVPLIFATNDTERLTILAGGNIGVGTPSPDRILDINGVTNARSDVVVDSSSKGLVLKSPDGHYWRVLVDNAGALSTTDLGTSKPS